MGSSHDRRLGEQAQLDVPVLVHRGPDRRAANALRRQYAPQLGPLRRRPVFLVSFIHVLGQVAVAVGVGALAVVGWRTDRMLGAALYIPIVVLIGTRFRALGNMIHEASHSMLARSTAGNKVLGQLLCAIDLSSFTRYAEEHRTHHLFVGDLGADRDLEGLRRFGFDVPGNFLRRHLLRPLALRHLGTYLRPRILSSADPWWATVLRLGYWAALAVFASVVGWQTFACLYVVPYCTSYQIFRYWSDASDHAGLIAEPDEFLRARNHIFRWRLWNVLVYPRNDQFHLVHHLFPSIPTAHQPQVHELLMGDASYRVRAHDVAAMVWPERAPRAETIEPPVTTWPAEPRAKTVPPTAVTPAIGAVSREPR